MGFLVTTSFNSHGLCSLNVQSSVGWHIKYEWGLIHVGNSGQLKVVLRLSKIDNIRMKFQNVILTGCWKIWGKFCSCPHAQTFSLHKVKAPLRCPWEIISVFFLCNPFTFFLYHLGWNRHPSATLPQNLGLHLMLYLQPLWRFPLHCLFLSWPLKSLSSCYLYNLLTLSMGGGPKGLSAALSPCFLAYLILA